MLKRLIDVVFGVAGSGLAALLYVPLAILIKLDSPGPILFTQKRLGKDESVIAITKFRTMHYATTPGGRKPDRDDDRITRVGRWLRRSSLDEFPQFYSILRGEMSLVGPRPEQLTLSEHYNGWQRRRFTIKPGLTGWWQVNGRKQPMYAHVDEDIYYVEHRSLKLDLIIIWRTIGVILSGDGAV